ncbi:MAG: hypothetical protein IPN01_30195 [Deltaproteobacteria bacterium]|nr:hypothetical protein [Deltaproteobacteria bacterium]
MSLSPDDEDTFNRFHSNLGRARSLGAVYLQLVGKGQGRVAVQYSDILRSAVVFLHATLEDLLRSLEEAHARRQLRSGVTDYPSIAFVLDSTQDLRKEKISVGDVVKHHYNKTVEDVVRLALDREFSTRTYNKPIDVIQAITRLKLDTSGATLSASTLQAMMQRRHQIAHRADHNPIRGRGQHIALPLPRALFETWLDTVSKLGDDLKIQLSRRST